MALTARWNTRNETTGPRVEQGEPYLLGVITVHPEIWRVKRFGYLDRGTRYVIARKGIAEIKQCRDVESVHKYFAHALNFNGEIWQVTTDIAVPMKSGRLTEIGWITNWSELPREWS